MKGGFSRVLYVSGFPAAVRHGELTTKFEEFGRIVGTKMPIVSGPNEFPYAFIEFEASINATTARGNMHHTLIRGERIEVHFDSKIPPHLRPRFDDDGSVNDVSPISPLHPPHLSHSGSDEGRQYSNEGYKSHPSADKPDLKDGYMVDRKPNGRYAQRPVPRSFRADDGNGTYQGERRRNGPSGAYVDRKPPGGPTRTRPYLANQGPPRPYERKNGAFARGGFRERSFRGRMQHGGDSRGYTDHVNIRGSYVDYEAGHVHSEHHDRRVSPPSHGQGRYNNGYVEHGKEGGDDWQSGDEDGHIHQPRQYSTSPSQRRTRSFSPDRNDNSVEHQGGQWVQSPHPDDNKFAAPSSVSPRGTKQDSVSGGGGSSSYYDDEFSIAPEVQPRAFSP
ncbi:hypothetical protein GGI20_003001 [Coemansia sp. BCRC 34301]|nr:hypothetical protein GGI20_003001 [Coemansia sp. BCRC 34301]